MVKTKTVPIRIKVADQLIIRYNAYGSSLPAKNKSLIKPQNYTEISRTVSCEDYNDKVILRLDRRIQELFSHACNKVNPLLDPAIMSQDD